MRGISSAMRSQIRASYVPIRIKGNQYRIEIHDFKRSPEAGDKHLEDLTKEVLKLFRQIEQAVSKSKQLDMSPDQCQDYLVKLAQLGRRAYRRFFGETAREILADYFQIKEVPCPTFLSESLPFPWEVLYEGNDYKEGNSEMFWGFRYAPARILKPGTDVFKHVLEQPLPNDMLFCLYHRLMEAHLREYPAIQQLVIARPGDRFDLLEPKGRMGCVKDGETLLEYMDASAHNMIHFACHCRHCDAGADALIVSLADNACVDGKHMEIYLETSNFEDIDGKFQRQPLVFLNACQSVGGADDLRRTYNLPRVFSDRGAAAVVATACPVPDLFAAAFARRFYGFFLKGESVVNEVTGERMIRQMSIGEALRETRRYFLERYHNPLGLAYGLYSPAYYRVERGLFAKDIVC